MSMHSPRSRLFPLIAAALLVGIGPKALASGDPSSGPILLFPGALPALNYGGSSQSEPFSGWNIPGKHFVPGQGWWLWSCAEQCMLSGATLAVRDSTHNDYDAPPLPSQQLDWTPIPASLSKPPLGVDSVTRLVPVEVELERVPDGVRSGFAMNVRLVPGDGEERVQLAASALVAPTCDALL